MAEIYFQILVADGGAQKRTFFKLRIQDKGSVQSRNGAFSLDFFQQDCCSDDFFACRGIDYLSSDYA